MDFKFITNWDWSSLITDEDEQKVKELISKSLGADALNNRLDEMSPVNYTTFNQGDFLHSRYEKNLSVIKLFQSFSTSCHLHWRENVNIEEFFSMGCMTNKYSNPKNHDESWHTHSNPVIKCITGVYLIDKPKKDDYFIEFQLKDKIEKVKIKPKRWYIWGGDIKHRASLCHTEDYRYVLSMELVTDIKHENRARY